MTPRSRRLGTPMGMRSGFLFVIALVFLVAMTSVAFARVDGMGGPWHGAPYAPYTPAPTVNDTPHAPHVPGPGYVPYTVGAEEYAPYTAGPVVREQPYAPYTAGPVVPEAEPYAPYEAGPVVH